MGPAAGVASTIGAHGRNDNAYLRGTDDYHFSGDAATYHATGLGVGDTVTQGPVTIEVVAIHDLLLNRNNAIDLHVTFDQTRLSEAP